MGHKHKEARTRVEAATLIRSVAEPRLPEDNIKSRMARAAMRLGWSYRRVEKIWRRGARVNVWEMDALRDYLADPDKL
jgi:hypothetical protein